METLSPFKRTKAQLAVARSTRKDIARLKLIAARISKIVKSIKDERKRSTV